MKELNQNQNVAQTKKVRVKEVKEAKHRPVLMTAAIQKINTQEKIKQVE